MQVFKSYFKILNKHKGQMIMYICIFISIMSILMANNSFESNSSYETTKPKFAVFNYSSSDRSNALVDYLDQTCILKEIANDKKETMQDELYARNVNCVLIIKEDETLDIVTIPDTRAAATFESIVNNFTKTYDTYAAAGYASADIISAVNTSLSQSAKVSLNTGKNVSSHTRAYYCFSYLGWLMLVMMIVGVSPVLQVFSKKELRERIECSSYKFSNFNRELLLGVVVTGIAVCIILFTAITIILNGKTFSCSGLMYTLNMACYMLVSLAFAFLLSKLTSNDQVLNMAANTISLAMAFLCGIFVPEEFLGDNIIKAAHFMPAYWYGQGVKNIDFHLNSSLPKIFTCMGIQLLFAIAIIVIALRISKMPAGKKA